MQRIIDGKTYNTETATLICDTGNDESVADFAFERSALYVTKQGAYFVAGQGGPLSRFSVPDGNGQRGGASVIPLSREQAFEEAQRCAGHNTDLITEYFSDMVTEA
jgi:hypothetical protein|tara:strand:- start:686 stop:1003 length:318 start_codon:yes stop_codon:yes gene_type:complete